MTPARQPTRSPRPSAALRLMVVDDTNLYRQLLCELLASLDGVEVVGTASDGKMALAALPQWLPDMLTLDVEMPVLDGLETLRHMHVLAPHVAAIMVSSHTAYGASTTVKALEAGAFDFVAKPSSLTENGVAYLQQRLQSIIKAWQTQKRLQGMRQGMESPQHDARSCMMTPVVKTEGLVTPGPLFSKPAAFDIVAIGVSTGGPQALAQVIPHLPGELPVPVVIVQHMPAAFTTALANSLHEKSALTVVEGQHGQVLEAGKVYIAPGGKQMKLVRLAGTPTPRVCITDDPPEHHCKPSADYLFRSVAALYAKRALGVIMTGMGADGVEGLRLMKQAGATVMAQDQASCVVFGMPMEAIKAGVVDSIVPLAHLAQAIRQHVARR